MLPDADPPDMASVDSPPLAELRAAAEAWRRGPAPEFTFPPPLPGAVVTGPLPAAGGVLGCPLDNCLWQVVVPAPTYDHRWNDDGGITATAHGIDPAHVEQVLTEHFRSHDVLDYLRTINRALRELAEREPVAEYGQLMASGGYQTRSPHPGIERIYPLADWISDHRQHGCKVYRRRLIVVEDWTEVEQP